MAQEETTGEEIGEQIYKRWWTMSNRDAYTGSMMREIAREAFEVGRQAGREVAALAVERFGEQVVCYECGPDVRGFAAAARGDNPEERR